MQRTLYVPDVVSYRVCGVVYAQYIIVYIVCCVQDPPVSRVCWKGVHITYMLHVLLRVVTLPIVLHINTPFLYAFTGRRSRTSINKQRNTVLHTKRIHGCYRYQYTVMRTGGFRVMLKYAKPYIHDFPKKYGVYALILPKK